MFLKRKTDKTQRKNKKSRKRDEIYDYKIVFKTETIKCSVKKERGSDIIVRSMVEKILKPSKHYSIFVFGFGENEGQVKNLKSGIFLEHGICENREPIS